MGRFINADDTFDENYELIGYNLYTYTRNSPMNFSDLTGRRLEIQGIFQEIRSIFLCLQQLTDDTLVVYSTGSPMGKMTAKVRIAKRAYGVLNKPAGTRLIRELIGLQKYCMIELVKTGDNYVSAMIRLGQLIAGMAANAYVRIRAAQATEFAPLYIILGYELIHAYHHMTGTNRMGDAQYIPYRTPVFEEAEELITVGLNAFPLDYTGVWVTENRLRAENGLPPRLVY